MSNDPTPPSDLNLGPSDLVPPLTQPIPTPPVGVTPAPFPPDVPGALYRDAANNFCRAWVGPEQVGYALVDATNGYPTTAAVYTAHTTDFLAVWTAQSGT